jgi:hypothetical protein
MPTQSQRVQVYQLHETREPRRTISITENEWRVEEWMLGQCLANFSVLSGRTKLL